MPVRFMKGVYKIKVFQNNISKYPCGFSKERVRVFLLAKKPKLATNY